MPLNKPTISHQLKTVKSHKPKSTSYIHSISNVGCSPQTRSHLISTHPYAKQSVFTQNGGHVIEPSNLSTSELKQCTKLLRNVLSSEENKSTSTDDYSCQKVVNSRSVAFKFPDPSFIPDQQSYPSNQTELISKFDDQTDAESLTSIADQKSIYSQTKYCCCSSTNNSIMHDNRLHHSSGNNEKLSICSRCHNIIPSPVMFQGKEIPEGGIYNKTIKDHNEEYNSGKIPDVHFNSNSSSTIYKSPHKFGNVAGDKVDDFMTHLRIKINELQGIARVTRDADLGCIISEIERGFQQMIQENSLLTNHLKTLAKTLKWENSTLKQTIKNQTESNRDMKSELKLARQEQKQKNEEVKLEVQLKNEEIRQLNDRDKTNILQMKEKYNALEKEHEKLRSEYQGQILQACHKDTDIIQLRHSCGQIEAKLKDEIHSLTLANQNLKKELQITETQCKKYEHELNHNQSIIKAAREQVVHLLDRHRQNRSENVITSYKYEPSFDLTASGEWIHQATNLQHVLSMASDNKINDLSNSRDRFGHSLSSAICPANYYSPNLPQSEQSNLTNESINNFATTNFNNNYVSSSTYNPNNTDSTNPVSNYEQVSSKQQSHFIVRSQSPSNTSSTLSDHSFNISAATCTGNLYDSQRLQTNQIKPRGSFDSSDSEVNDDPWSLPHPSKFKKISSASSMMSTVSSLRSTDDREFRQGLQRLDSQISRLQNTLQSNLRCK